MYRLDYAEPYQVKETQLSNSTHQSFKWVTLAVCGDLEVLKSFMQQERQKHPYCDYRIEDSNNGEIIIKDYKTIRSA